MDITLPSAVANALPAEFARRLVETMSRITERVAQVVIFCPERQCVVVGIASRKTLQSWLIAPALDLDDATAIGQSLLPFFSGVADALGHFKAADVIDRARSH